MDPYSTHFPITAVAAQKTLELFPDLPILECGCGNYSTPLLWLMAGGRKQVIYSADPEWSDHYKNLAEVITVKLDAPKKWEKVAFPEGWGLCLMDSEESVANRITHIPGLLEKSKVVIMHDCREDMVPDARYFAILQGFRPWTWIGSNSVNVEEWFPDLAFMKKSKMFWDLEAAS